jgi:hypothetical protein
MRKINLFKTLKILFIIIFCGLVGVGTGMLTFHRIQQLTELPSLSEIMSDKNISTYLTRTEQKVIQKSRLSSVKVVSLALGQDLFMIATGTYFTMKDRYFVLTVNHGVPGDCKYTKINVNGKFLNCKQFIELNLIADYAIIEVDEIEGREPIDMSSVLPRGHQWKQALAIMNEVYYTGYPNNTGPLTIKGEIIGYTPGGLIYMHSHAWSGASGSGVFNASGDLIGYVLAVDIGFSELGGDVLESVVIIAPTYQIDWDVI